MNNSEKEMRIATLRQHLQERLQMAVQEGVIAERERLVILSRLAIADGQWATLAEVAGHLGVGCERVRHIQNGAMRKVCRQSECAELFAEYLALVPPPQSRHRLPSWLPFSAKRQRGGS